MEHLLCGKNHIRSQDKTTSLRLGRWGLNETWVFMKTCTHVGLGLRAGSWVCWRTGGWVEEGLVHKAATG